MAAQIHHRSIPKAARLLSAGAPTEPRACAVEQHIRKSGSRWRLSLHSSLCPWLKGTYRRFTMDDNINVLWFQLYDIDPAILKIPIFCSLWIFCINFYCYYYIKILFVLATELFFLFWFGLVFCHWRLVTHFPHLSPEKNKIASSSLQSNCTRTRGVSGLGDAQRCRSEASPAQGRSSARDTVCKPTGSTPCLGTRKTNACRRMRYSFVYSSTHFF